MAEVAASAGSAAAASHVVQGRVVQLPVVVRDADAASAMYPVRTAAVRKLLPTPTLHPAEGFPGWAVFVLASIQYTDNDLGSYNEFGVTFLVTHGPRPALPLLGMIAAARGRTLGAYVHRLPVTTSFSRDAGRDIWGYPKTVASITITRDGDRRVCRMADEDTHVLTFTTRTGGGGRAFPEVPQDSYTWRDGTLFRTPSRMSADRLTFRLGGADLTLGAHPIAAELRTLGLPRRALGTTSFTHWRATFEGAQILERSARA
jgi:hypothetical protein